MLFSLNVMVSANIAPVTETILQEKHSLVKISSMNPPMEVVDLNPEKLEEEKEDGPLIHCDLCDADTVHEIAEAFLPGLASACIDNTIGGLLKSQASVAVDIRREMVDYLTHRSDNFVAEVVVLEADPVAQVPENPYEIISDFVDDFVSSKRNFVSRVSRWLLSERREDRIDDLMQEMEINGFWLLNRRVSVAQTLLKNIDFKNTYHCSSKFKSKEDLEEHKSNCSFRTMACVNEGCNSTFSVGQMDYHDSICPFKILPCEQKCPDNIRRREMDRHCITICPMKLVKCPFYLVGCQSLVAQSTIGQHRFENLHSHLFYVLQGFHREASVEDLNERVEQLQKLSSPGQLASARDARILANFIKDIDAKLGSVLPKYTKAKPVEEIIDFVDVKESINELPMKYAPTKKEEGFVNSPSKGNNHEYSYRGKEELVESPSKLDSQSQPDIKKMSGLIYVDESLKESPVQREENPRSHEKVEVQMGKSLKEEVINYVKEHCTSPVKQKEQIEPIGKREKLAESSPVQQEHATSTSERQHAEFSC